MDLLRPATLDSYATQDGGSVTVDQLSRVLGFTSTAQAGTLHDALADVERLDLERGAMEQRYRDALGLVVRTAEVIANEVRP